MSHVLHAAGLTKRFRKHDVVHEVGLQVHQGEIVGLLGPNGAGKTTTFRMIAGEIKVDDGSIWFDDTDITRWHMYRRARLGITYLPQEPSVFRGLTTEENVIAVLEIHKYSKQEIRQRLEEVLREFNLEQRRKVTAKNLSGGERRRLEVMRALALRPHFMLLDEPFAGVDPIAVEDLQRIVGTLKEKNIGVLITDHNVHETLEITDRAYVMYEGNILIQGTPREIAQHASARKMFLGEKFRLRGVSE